MILWISVHTAKFRMWFACLLNVFSWNSKSDLFREASLFKIQQYYYFIISQKWAATDGTSTRPIYVVGPDPDMSSVAVILVSGTGDIVYIFSRFQNGYQ